MSQRPPAVPDGSVEAADDGSGDGGHGRPVAAGGRLRLVLGFLIGALIGALLALVLPRDDGPRRSPQPVFPADPLGPGPPADPPPR